MRHAEKFYVTILLMMCAYSTQIYAGECRIDYMAKKPYVPIKYNPKSCYSVKCDHQMDVPQTYPESPTGKSLCFLNLSWNNFSVIGNYSFVNAEHFNSSAILFLYLDNSNISRISSNAFSGLSSLLYLNLSKNHLKWPSGFGKGVFRPLTNLRYLNIKENDIHSFEGLGQELGYMKNLEGIYAELCENCTFDKEFAQLKRLVNVSLSGRSKDTCNVGVLYNNTFEGLRTLQRLWLSSCNIKAIEANAFLPLNDSLNLLDISYNEEICFDGMNKALNGLRYSTKLQVLNVNRIHSVHGLGVAVRVNDTENLSTLQALTTLHMDLNKIEVFDESILYPKFKFPATLRDLTLSGNRLSLGKYILFIKYALNVTCLDISRQHLYYDPFIQEHFEDESTDEEPADKICMENITTYTMHESTCDSIPRLELPPNLRRVKWRKSFLNIDLDLHITVCGARQLSHVDLSFNLLTKWKTSFKGLETVTHLDLSENYCSEVVPKFFDSFKHLTHLNISGNNLGVSFGKTPSSNLSGGIFGSLKEISNLDLSNNKIERFADKLIFKDMVNIQFLYLHSNFLNVWDYKMPSTKSLKLIDLSQNKFRTLNSMLMDYLDKQCRGTSCNVSLVLNNNPLECSCTTLPFLKWMLSTKVNVQRDKCTGSFDNRQHNISTKATLHKIIETLVKKECRDKSWITWTVGTVCALVGCFTSIVLVIVVYKNRWKLRYLYYSRNRRFHHNGFERLFENDAFVSYSKCKASFIKNYMVPSLEEQRGLHLWVADRNSIPGSSVAENICHGIYNSRKSVLLVDKDYLKDGWCDYEMNMVHVESVESKRKLIVIVLMENIPREDLPTDILLLLRSERSLEYPEHGQDMDTFWSNLADEIMI